MKFGSKMAAVLTAVFVLIALVLSTDAYVEAEASVVAEKMELLFEDHETMSMDLKSGEHPVFTLKEGVEYKIRLSFQVQHNIVTGLRYFHRVSRRGISSDRESFMVGNYGPKEEAQTYTSPVLEAPRGMTYRGSYKVKSKMLDAFRNEILAWEWTMNIRRNWE